MLAKPAALAALVLLTAVPAHPAVADGAAGLDRGRALYENHCTACHTSKVHRRFPPRAIDLEALRFIVKVWVEENRLSWGPQEIEDVVEYLDRTHYRFSR